jgi:hypothetical protein
VHGGRHIGHRRFAHRGFGNYNPCWNYPYTYGLDCPYPGYGYY